MERNEQKEGFYTDAWRSWKGGKTQKEGWLSGIREKTKGVCR